MARWITEDERQAFAAEYEAGASLQEIADRYGVTGPTVANQLQRLGVERRQGKLPTFDVDLAQKLYAEGQTAVEVGRMLGVTANVVAKHLKRRGVAIRGKLGSNRRTQTTWRELLVDTWTPEKAWFLGALWGDGHIYASQGTYKIGIASPHQMVERWLHLVEPDKEPQKIKNADSYQGHCYSKELVEWFANTYGLQPGPKSDKLFWPHDMPAELNVHFLRGLWDTDGCLFIERRDPARGKDVAVALYSSNSTDFVETVRAKLAELGVSGGSVCTGITGNTTLKYAGVDNAHGVAQLLYADAPEHIRNELRYEKHLEFERLLSAQEERCPCGNFVRAEGLCWECWRNKNGLARVRKMEGPCPCGKLRIMAQGLCSACYSRKRRGEQKEGVWVEKRDRARIAGEGLVCKECAAPKVLAKGLCSPCYQRQRLATLSKRGGDSNESGIGIAERIRRVGPYWSVSEAGAESSKDGSETPPSG